MSRDYHVLCFSATHLRDENSSKLFRVNIFSNGQVNWTFGSMFKVICPVDLTYFPFDTQHCTLLLENWSYALEEVDYFSAGMADFDYIPNVEWELVRIDAKESFTEVRHASRFYAHNIIC